MAKIKPDIIDVRSEFEQLSAQKLGTESLEEYYNTLLTAGAQKASQASSLYYGQQQQAAAETASYDISKAYANYLKQQRNVMGATNLMAGHQEELSSALKSSFESSAQQARDVEAQNLAMAASKASNIYSDVYKTESAAAKSLYDTLMTDVQKKTDLYKAVESRLFDEEYVKSLGINTGYTTEAGDEVKFNIYETKDGKIEFTDYGKDVLSKALLADPFAFEQYLESEGEIELLEYYKDNPLALREELFGLKEESYGLTTESKELSNQRLFGTEGYIESITKPSTDVDIATWTGGLKQTEFTAAVDELTKYSNQLELSQEDVTKGLVAFFESEANNVKLGVGQRNAYRRTAELLSDGSFSINEILTMLGDNLEDEGSSRGTALKNIYPKIITAIENTAKTKYRTPKE